MLGLVFCFCGGCLSVWVLFGCFGWGGYLLLVVVLLVLLSVVVCWFVV